MKLELRKGIIIIIVIIIIIIIIIEFMRLL